MTEYQSPERVPAAAVLHLFTNERRNPMENFGQRLRRLRGERSQRDVATELEIPVTTLSTLENQDTIPRGEVLQKLAEYYKIPITYFYTTASTEIKASDAAHAWVQQLREPAHGKDTVATQSNIQLNEKDLEKIAERIRRRHAKISDHK
jgi:transcriptional regulator with XRE-family HTH domain